MAWIWKVCCQRGAHGKRVDLEGDIVDAEGGLHAGKHALLLVNLLNSTQLQASIALHRMHSSCLDVCSTSNPNH